MDKAFRSLTPPRTRAIAFAIVGTWFRRCVAFAADSQRSVRSRFYDPTSMYDFASAARLISHMIRASRTSWRRMRGCERCSAARRAADRSSDRPRRAHEAGHAALCARARRGRLLLPPAERLGGVLAGLPSAVRARGELRGRKRRVGCEVELHSACGASRATMPHLVRSLLALELRGLRRGIRRPRVDLRRTAHVGRGLRRGAAALGRQQEAAAPRQRA